jgi:hypothetical protein
MANDCLLVCCRPSFLRVTGRLPSPPPPSWNYFEKIKVLSMAAALLFELFCKKKKGGEKGGK